MSRSAAAGRLIEEPHAPLGLVDPVLQQACRGDVVLLVAELVSLAQGGNERLIVGTEFGHHVQRIDIVGVVVRDTLQPGDQQFDIGPKTSALFEQKVKQFIETHRGQPTVAFHNGVFGMFEDPRFEAGTKAFIAQLKPMKDAGLAVYVGGGEGGTALEKYGRPDWVTHCFTAGGTVLNALGAEPVPYLVALRAATKP